MPEDKKYAGEVIQEILDSEEPEPMDPVDAELLSLSSRVARLEVAVSTIGALVGMTAHVLDSAVKVAAGTLGKLGSLGANTLGPWIEKTKAAVDEINNSFDYIEEDDDDESVEVAPI